MRVLSLFAGIGGFDLAAEWMGWTVVGQVEIDPWCRRVLAKHWPDVPKAGDIHEVKGGQFGPVDLVCGGFPCQPFSVAGKRRGADDDRALWPEMRRVIAEAAPRHVVAENVAGILGAEIDRVQSDLEGLGYEVWFAVLPAAGVGALHKRDRVWIVAQRADPAMPSRHCGVFGGAVREPSDGRGSVGEPQRLGAVGSGPTDVGDPALGGPRCGPASWPCGQPAQSGQGTRPDVGHAAGVGVEGGRERRHGDGEGLGQEALPDGTGAGGGRSGGAPAEPGVRGTPDGLPDRVDGAGGGLNRDGNGPDRAGAGRCLAGVGGNGGIADGGRGCAASPGIRERFLDPAWDGDPLAAFGRGWEYGVPLTVTEKVPDRANRLKAAGNAIVPQAAYAIFRAIAETEETR